MNRWKGYTFDILHSNIPACVHHLPLPVDKSHPEVEDDVEDEEHLHEDVRCDGGLEVGGVAVLGGHAREGGVEGDDEGDVHDGQEDHPVPDLPEVPVVEDEAEVTLET